MIYESDSTVIVTGIGLITARLGFNELGVKQTLGYIFFIMLNFYTSHNVSWL